MVAWEASAKLVKRRTEKIAVKPMAGTARMAPVMTPLTTSCRTCMARPLRSRLSDNLQKLELAGFDLHVAEFATQDVANLGEVARAARALIVDVLSLADVLQAFNGTVDLLSTPLGDLADIVAQRLAGGLPGVGDGERHDAHPVGRLTLIGIGLGDAQPLRRELEGLRVDVGRRLAGVQAFCHLGRQRLERLGRHSI